MTPFFRRRPRLVRGFTLIEILIVITIIGILSTMLIVGISHLKTSANRQQTHQLLQNCAALYNEYDATQHLHMDQFEMDSPGNVTAAVEAATEIATPNAQGDRLGFNVTVTRSLFTQMRSLPNIRTAMDKFPAGRQFLPIISSGLFKGGYWSYNGNAWVSNSQYNAGGTIVSYTLPLSVLAPTSYLAVTTHLSSDGSVPLTPGGAPQPNNAPPNKACWFSMLADPQVPVLEDAWGNPIIVVLGGVLGNGPTGNFGQVYAGGYVNAGGINVQVTSPDNRLFFASAGPDGDFSKGNDNLYSFDFK